MSKVRGHRLLPRDGSADAELIETPRKPGEFIFALFDQSKCHAEDLPHGTEGRFSFGCPRGTGHCGAIIIGNGFRPNRGAPTWQWDGNADAPTLTPSIHCRSRTVDGRRAAGCGWHGSVSAGVFRD